MKLHCISLSTICLLLLLVTACHTNKKPSTSSLEEHPYPMSSYAPKFAVGTSVSSNYQPTVRYTVTEFSKLPGGLHNILSRVYKLLSAAVLY